jgi:23S rRNA pseudouridine1911/1915/1917 synthase
VTTVSGRSPSQDLSTVTDTDTVTDTVTVTEIALVFEDEWLLAVDKPAGTVVHPTYRHRTGTLMDALRQYARDWPAGTRPSLIGRLDKMTSGLVLIAKTPAVHAAFQRTMTSAAGDKEYLAVVHGRVDVERGSIDFPLAHDPADRRRMIVSPDGSPSLTRFTRLAIGPAHSLLCCHLMTGRHHQIRCHLAATGWPISGDAVYGVPDGVSRQALHAWRMSFAHPITHARIELDAPLPPDIERLIASVGLAQPLTT